MGAILFFIFLYFLASLLKIKSVNCYCDGQSCPNEVCLLVKNQIGNNYLRFNKNKLIKSLVEKGQYKDVKVSTTGLGSISVNLQSQLDFFIFNSTITTEKISLSLNQSPISSESSVIFYKPTEEISAWLKNYQLISIKVYSGGQQEVISTASSQIFSVTSEKKDENWYRSAFKLIKLVSVYTSVQSVYFVDNNVYFAQVNLPDIIVNLDYDEGKLLKTLQSVRFLTTIKKDPKIIDLRYTNPIIR